MTQGHDGCDGSDTVAALPVSKGHVKGGERVLALREGAPRSSEQPPVIKASSQRGPTFLKLGSFRNRYPVLC